MLLIVLCIKLKLKISEDFYKDKKLFDFGNYPKDDNTIAIKNIAIK